MVTTNVLGIGAADAATQPSRPATSADRSRFIESHPGPPPEG